MAPVILNESDIQKFLIMKPPFVFVSHAEVIPGQSAKGYRDFPESEWFFRVHFPNDPLVPGVFLQECLMQTATLALYADNPQIGTIYAKKFTALNFLASVRPNDRLYAQTEILSSKRGLITAKGRGFILKNGKEQTAVKADFQMFVPSVLNSFSLSNKDA